MSHLWFLYALMAAVFWGFAYAVSGKILQAGIPPVFLIFLESVMFITFYTFFVLSSGAFKTGMGIINANKTILMWMTLMILSSIAGRYIILLSISLKNPTISSLIEITYPFFTLIFAWLLFREVHLTWATAIGSFLIFLGVGMIYLKG